MAPIMSFWGTISNIPKCPSYYAYQWPLVQKNKNVKYFGTECPQRPLCTFEFLGCPLTSYPMPSTLDILVPTIAWKESFHVQPCATSVSRMHFSDHVIICCHFVIPCWHSSLFVVPHLLSSLALFGDVFVVDQVYITAKPKHPIDLNFY